MPDWAVKNSTFPSPLPFSLQRDENGVPETSDCLKKPFAIYYLAYDVGNNFKRLFTNEDNLTEAFANKWRQIADYFKDEENVIGYEILNEPPGTAPLEDLYHFFKKGYQNDHYLLPFYREVNKKIREVDNDTLLFYEPIVFDFLGGGFSENVGGEEFKDREVLSYHVYCPFVDK